METHYGQTIERIIRRNGYSITELARLTSVNRRSVYNWFNNQDLKPEIIYRVGTAINYDFSTLFPWLFVSQDFQPSARTGNPSVASAPVETSTGKTLWKDRYIQLLERYNEMLQEYLSKPARDQQGDTLVLPHRNHALSK